MKVLIAVALFCGVLLFVGLPESALARTEAVPRTNQIWSTCGGSCRQRSCDNPNENERDCVAQCVEGWRCESGYIRRSVPNGPCVLESNCPDTSSFARASVKVPLVGAAALGLGKK